jgi:signal peptidase I
MDDSTAHPGRKAEVYRALIKPGDAIETPDGELWVVTEVLAEQLALVSAYRSADERICADVYEPTHTVVPAAMVTKVADARRVRR